MLDRCASQPFTTHSFAATYWIPRLVCLERDARAMSLGICFPLDPVRPVHRCRGSILKEIVGSICFTVSVASGSSQEMTDLHNMCVSLFFSLN